MSVNRYKIKWLDIHLNPSWQVIGFELSGFGLYIRIGRLFIGVCRKKLLVE
jgi:hypothetical protein